MKKRTCPHCQQALFTKSAWEIFKHSEHTCSSCGKTCRLSMFGLNVIFLVFMAIIIFVGNRLGYTIEALIVCAVSAIVYILLSAWWIPLIPTSPAYKQAGQETHQWYQAPIIWIALVVTVLVLWWNSLGLE